MSHEKHQRSSITAGNRAEPHITGSGWPQEADRFDDRVEAGRVLSGVVAEQVLGSDGDRPLILALPRGGVVVGREIAQTLAADLDVLIAHKIGLPWRPDFSIGAVAEDGPPLFDRGALAGSGETTATMAPSVRRERLEIQRRREQYRGDRPAESPAGRTVVIVDDGLTSSMVVRAAVRAVRAGSPSYVTYAAPVCAAESADWLRREADEVIHLHNPRVFPALGLWYRNHDPVTHDDVRTILDEFWQAQSLETHS